MTKFITWLEPFYKGILLGISFAVTVTLAGLVIAALSIGAVEFFITIGEFL